MKYNNSTCLLATSLGLPKKIKINILENTDKEIYLSEFLEFSKPENVGTRLPFTGYQYACARSLFSVSRITNDK